MYDETKITFTIDMAAKKVINQVMLTNESIQLELEESIKNAIENFDFKTEVTKQVNEAITKAIQDSSSWGSIRQMAREKADKIVEEHIEKELAQMRESFNKKTD